MQNQKIIIEPEFNKQRLDVFLHSRFPETSRSYFQKLIKDNHVKINDEPTNAGYKLKTNDILTVIFPETTAFTDVVPEDIPIKIIYEDDYVIILDKPSGMVVHPACGNFTGTLVNALVYHFNKLPISRRDINGWIRPGLVHRLDKETSGIMIIAKTEDSMINLAKQIEKRTVKKIYLALAKGMLKDREGIIDAPIGRCGSDRKKMMVTANNAKQAITYFRILDEWPENMKLLELEIKTGRTHQIRVHLKYIKCPIIGDKEYGVHIKFLDEVVHRTMLHSSSIEFTHPQTKERMKFVSDLPDDFKKVLDVLKKN